MLIDCNCLKSFFFTYEAFSELILIVTVIQDTILQTTIPGFNTTKETKVVTL